MEKVHCISSSSIHIHYNHTAVQASNSLYARCEPLVITYGTEVVYKSELDKNPEVCKLYLILMLYKSWAALRVENLLTYINRSSIKILKSVSDPDAKSVIEWRDALRALGVQIAAASPGSLHTK